MSDRHKNLTDQQVVALARQGREAAYRELIGRYERPVFSLIYRLVRDRERAEDLAQETFIKVLNALDRYDPAFKFSSWIFKIAHNTALDHLRKKEPVTLSLHGSPHAQTAAEAEASTLDPASQEENPEEYASSRELGAHIESAV
ncbi:MAG: RNA polymerase sigma factor, partial [Gemmatimonadota bacterium]